MYPDQTQQPNQNTPPGSPQNIQQTSHPPQPQQAAGNNIANAPTHPPNPNPPGKPAVPPSSNSGRHEAIEKVEQITMFTYFGIAALLLFRFVLSLFGASRTTPFVDFVFQLTTPFMIPFNAMFGGPVGVSDYQLEFEVLVAILVYGLVFFGIARLIKIIFR